MKTIIIAILGTLFICFSNTTFANELKTPENLAGCDSASNCLRIDWPILDPEQSIMDIAKIIDDMPRTTIVESKPSYIHAEVKSKVFKFIDDLEILRLTNDNAIEIRSSSRVGSLDFGVNRKRVVNLLTKLKES